MDEQFKEEGLSVENTPVKQEKKNAWMVIGGIVLIVLAVSTCVLITTQLKSKTKQVTEGAMPTSSPVVDVWKSAKVMQSPFAGSLFTSECTGSFINQQYPGVWVAYDLEKTSGLYCWSSGFFVPNESKSSDFLGRQVSPGDTPTQLVEYHTWQTTNVSGEPVGPRYVARFYRENNRAWLIFYAEGQVVDLMSVWKLIQANQ